MNINDVNGGSLTVGSGSGVSGSLTVGNSGGLTVNDGTVWNGLTVDHTSVWESWSRPSIYTGYP